MSLPSSVALVRSIARRCPSSMETSLASATIAPATCSNRSWFLASMLSTHSVQERLRRRANTTTSSSAHWRFSLGKEIRRPTATNGGPSSFSDHVRESRSDRLATAGNTLCISKGAFAQVSHANLLNALTRGRSSPSTTTERARPRLLRSRKPYAQMRFACLPQLSSCIQPMTFQDTSPRVEGTEQRARRYSIRTNSCRVGAKFTRSPLRSIRNCVTIP